MWSQGLLFFTLIAVTLAEITAPGIDRTVSEGVTSHGFTVVYGDEDIAVINEVVSDAEKRTLKSKVRLNEALPPLPFEDVKCLMSVDKYCSKEMRTVKSVLIQAVKDDCSTCTDEQREKAGKIAASMMAHDRHAWKMFLSRYGAQNNVQRILG